ncbi:MAG: hypothetical protein WC809_07275 [Sinimarinibacterium sp.]|jgi:hypothetical protein
MSVTNFRRRGKAAAPPSEEVIQQLEKALAHGDLESIRELHDQRKARIAVEGARALAAAAGAGNSDAVKLLLEIRQPEPGNPGAPPEGWRIFKESAHCRAAREAAAAGGHADIVKLLDAIPPRQGAQEHTVSAHAPLPTDHAVGAKSPGSAPRPSPQLPELLHAAGAGDLATVARLVEAHDVRLTSDGGAALVEAAGRGQREVVAYLMTARQSDPSAPGGEARISPGGELAVSAALEARQQGHEDVVTDLLRHGVHPGVLAGHQSRAQVLSRGVHDRASAPQQEQAVQDPARPPQTSAPPVDSRVPMSLLDRAVTASFHAATAPARALVQGMLAGISGKREPAAAQACESAVGTSAAARRAIADYRSATGADERRDRAAGLRAKMQHAALELEGAAQAVAALPEDSETRCAWIPRLRAEVQRLKAVAADKPKPGESDAELQELAEALARIAERIAALFCRLFGAIAPTAQAPFTGPTPS